jgi:hypothetical protein
MWEARDSKGNGKIRACHEKWRGGLLYSIAASRSENDLAKPQAEFG